MDALGKLFGSPARLKLLRAFIFSPGAALSAESLAARLALPGEKLRAELAALAGIGLVRKSGAGAKARYALDRRYPHLAALDRFIRETTAAEPADLKRALRQAGSPEVVVLSGFFTGLSESSVDLLVVGDALKERALARAVRGIEAELGREIRYAVLSGSDFRYRHGVYDRLLRDIFDYPHRVIVDRIGL
ncbi:MAG TPA: hypothetical protein VHC68_02740 [Candidatus Paceibacterota bacterium]|nr:hypothetical protein [Candidatus Paceibacterota bacterium]